MLRTMYGVRADEILKDDRKIVKYIYTPPGALLSADRVFIGSAWKPLRGVLKD